ncbi:MAG: DUF420 domain-containing protein [Ignavibacteria bacterium]|nr:DUF420 domain-containing protein [Ignavibacteria bacterium]
MDQLPAINATLNAASTILLLTGFGFIRRKRIKQHRFCMISAFILSMLFLVGYLAHKWHLYSTTGSYNTAFHGQGAFKGLYFSILITHVALAATVPVLASITLFRGLKMSVVKHKRLARVTLPIWLYVSVTGVIVYFMLYQWSPQS